MWSAAWCTPHAHPARLVLLVLHAYAGHRGRATAQCSVYSAASQTVRYAMGADRRWLSTRLWGLASERFISTWHGLAGRRNSPIGITTWHLDRPLRRVRTRLHGADPSRVVSARRHRG